MFSRRNFLKRASAAPLVAAGVAAVAGEPVAGDYEQRLVEAETWGDKIAITDAPVLKWMSVRDANGEVFFIPTF